MLQYVSMSTLLQYCSWEVEAPEGMPCSSHVRLKEKEGFMAVVVTPTGCYSTWWDPPQKRRLVPVGEDLKQKRGVIVTVIVVAAVVVFTVISGMTSPWGVILRHRGVPVRLGGVLRCGRAALGTLPVIWGRQE